MEYLNVEHLQPATQKHLAYTFALGIRLGRENDCNDKCVWFPLFPSQKKTLSRPFWVFAKTFQLTNKTNSVIE